MFTSSIVATVDTPRSEEDTVEPVILDNIAWISVILELMESLTAVSLALHATRVRFWVELKEMVFMLLLEILAAR